ncbi:HNH endonuclease [Hymenobacter sp. YC55]|uniref:HNH endonuclease n=1 Tax=Hymenobacter sp. YC55 TaxID=3034019 RepID=UPI0023FA34BE|nr:HNH endonuclease [Hymenobacter sp. YC55]MDF7810724.1 HNH endonuclease [Hymenobacter sp. YC55]
MKKLRHLARDIDPETGDVEYFKKGYTCREIKFGWYQKQSKRPPKVRKSDRKARKKQRANRLEHYNCPPRPLFHTSTPQINKKARYQLKMEVFRRDRFTCQQCGARNNLTLDHYIPLSRGGGWHLDNLQCLCQRCNEEKDNKMPYERQAA